MAGFGSTFGNGVLLLFLQATAITGLAVNHTSSPATNLYASLHTASPGSGNQTTSEATFGAYARVAIARTSGGFSVASLVASLVASATFPASTGTPSETLTHFSIGRDSTSTGLVMFYGTITPNVTMNASGITVSLTTSTTVTLS